MIYALLGAAAVLLMVWLRSHFAGFTAQRSDDYADATPAFDLRTHLSGPILCEGVIYGPTGRVVSRFVADMEGQWSGNTGTLHERFRYDSGNRQDRLWHLTVGNDGNVTAAADDVIGTGHGEQRGPTLRLDYRIRLPKEAGGHVLNVTDWMYLVENGTIINRSQFRKFGLKVAELVATLRRVES